MSDSDFLGTTSELERLFERVNEADDEDAALAALDAVSVYLTNCADLRRSGASKPEHTFEVLGAIPGHADLTSRDSGCA